MAQGIVGEKAIEKPNGGQETIEKSMAGRELAAQETAMLETERQNTMVKETPGQSIKGPTMAKDILEEGGLEVERLEEEILKEEELEEEVLEDKELVAEKRTKKKDTVERRAKEKNKPDTRDNLAVKKRRSKAKIAEEHSPKQHKRCHKSVSAPIFLSSGQRTVSLSLFYNAAQPDLLGQFVAVIGRATAVCQLKDLCHRMRQQNFADTYAVAYHCLQNCEEFTLVSISRIHQGNHKKVSFDVSCSKRSRIMLVP